MTRSIQPSIDRMRRADQHRRDEFLVEQDVLVADLEDARDAEADVAGLGGLAQFEGQPRIGDVDLLLDAQRGGRIDEGLGAADDSGWRCPTSAVVDLARVRRRDRHRSARRSGRRRSPERRSAPGSGCRPECRTACRPASRRRRGASANLLCWARSWSISSCGKAPRIGRDLPDPALEQVFDDNDRSAADDAAAGTGLPTRRPCCTKTFDLAPHLHVPVALRSVSYQ